MTRTERHTFFVCNAIAPLALGLVVYLTKTEQTYLSNLFPTFRSLLHPVDYPTIIKNYACDFLWAYSMYFCFRLTLGEELKGSHNLRAIVLAGVTAVLLESLQQINRFPGTFDWFDIAFEIIAILVANFISILLERRVHYEKKKTN